MKRFFVLFVTLIFLSCASTKEGKSDLPDEDIASEITEEIINEDDFFIDESIEIADESEDETIVEEIDESITITDVEPEPEEEPEIEMVHEVPVPVEMPQITQTPVPPPAQTQTPQRPQTNVPPPQPIIPFEQPQPPALQTEEALELEPLPEEESRRVPPPAPFPRETPPTPFQSVLVPGNEEPVFSRTVRAVVGQIIEIPFYGTGWVYLGEIASRRGIVYDSRRLDPAGQSFLFRAETAGTYALKFFKEDFLRDFILNDHVQVIVGESPIAGAGWFGPPIDRGRVIAEPRWPSASEEAQIQRGGIPQGGSASENRVTPSGVPPPARRDESAPQNAPSTVASAPTDRVPETAIIPPDAGLPVQPPPPLPPVPITPPTGVLEQPFTLDREQSDEAGAVADQMPENIEILTPDEIIERAKESFDAGNVAAAIALLDQYSKFYPSGTDELYWLYGQFYEANTPSRNILLSLDYYRRLIDEYPQSRRFNDARRRIAYLERFYINIQ